MLKSPLFPPKRWILILVLKKKFFLRANEKSQIRRQLKEKRVLVKLSLILIPLVEFVTTMKQQYQSYDHSYSQESEKNYICVKWIPFFYLHPFEMRYKYKYVTRRKKVKRGKKKNSSHQTSKVFQRIKKKKTSLSLCCKRCMTITAAEWEYVRPPQRKKNRFFFWQATYSPSWMSRKLESLVTLTAVEM